MQLGEGKPSRRMWLLRSLRAEFQECACLGQNISKPTVSTVRFEKENERTGLKTGHDNTGGRRSATIL
jgi:hypothetical protein